MTVDRDPRLGMSVAMGMSGREQSAAEWRHEFFHGWLREHTASEGGRCAHHRCYRDRARHPCQLRRHAVAALVQDGHIDPEMLPAIELGLPCCVAARPPGPPAIWRT